jgi:small-conductance mechanosensitive channel
MGTLPLKYWIFVVITLVVAYVLVYFSRRILNRAIRKRSFILKEDPTKFVFLKNSMWLIIFSIAIILILLKTPGLENVGKGVFAGAGIMAAAIGFAAQKVFANIIGGTFILIFRPFRVFDTIEVTSESVKGVVEEITLRHTVIRNYENRRIIIPNSSISESTLINSTIVDEKVKKFIDFGISYDSDIDKAKDIIKDEIMKHPSLIDNRTKEEKSKNIPIVPVRVVALADYYVQIRAYVWSASNDDAFSLQCDVLESVKKRFDKEGVEIPFPYRTLVFKNNPAANEEVDK